MRFLMSRIFAVILATAPLGAVAAVVTDLAATAAFETPARAPIWIYRLPVSENVLKTAAPRVVPSS